MTLLSVSYAGLAKSNNAKILQASTSEIYGNPEVSPWQLSTGMLTLLDTDLVMMKEKCSETLFMDYHREHNLDIKDN